MPILKYIILYLGLAIIAGCASPKKAAKIDNLEKSEIIFLDLDSFDSRFVDSMKDNTQEIVVNFGGDQVTTNDIPPRMQKWLSAVDEKGGGLRVESDGPYQEKSLLAALALVPKSYQWIKKRYEQNLVTEYRAVVKTGSDGSV